MVDASQRLSTGLAGLDAQLGGGVPAGSVHILLSEPMNAQELLALHFAGGDEHSVFYATEVSEDEIGAGLDRIGADREGVRVVRLPNGTGWAIHPKDDDKRVIVDSFSRYARQAGPEELQKTLDSLRAFARRTGSVVMLMVNLGLHSDEDITLLKLWADGVMELGLDRQGFGLYPFLKVTKMRGVPDSARFLLFKETERGLFMESTRRVF